MESLFDLYSNLDIYLLIFARIFFALIVLPMFLERGIPVLIKIGVPLILSLLVFLTLQTPSLSEDISFLSYTFLFLKESLVGLILGFSISIFFNVYYMFGFLVSMQGGINMSNIFDPQANGQVSLIGKLYTLILTTLFMVSGGFNWFIQAVVLTFEKIPLHSALFSGDLFEIFIRIFISFFSLSFKLAVPIIAILFLVDCGLGILARTVPQMNMFVIGIPLKIIVLFVLLYLTLLLLPSFNEMIFTDLKQAFEALVQGMMS